MDSLLVAVAVLGFVTQLALLYGGYVEDKPRLVLVTYAGYAFFWASLAIVEFSELHFAAYGLPVLLAILLVLTALNFRRRRQKNRRQSA